MKMHYLKLQNYRCFDSLELSFHPELTVIVGANGAGKSAILDAMTVAFGPYLAKFDDGKGAGFNKQDARRCSADLSLLEMVSQYPVTLEALGSWNTSGMENALSEEPRQPGLFSSSGTDLYDTPAQLLQHARLRPAQDTQNALYHQSWAKGMFYWRRELTGPKNKTTIVDASSLELYGKTLQKSVRQGQGVVLPILGYYGAGRAWVQQKLTESRKALLTESRTLGYRDCLAPSSSYKEFAYWFQQLHTAIRDAHVYAEQHLTDKRFKVLKDLHLAVIQAVNTCLQASDWKDIYYDFIEKQIKVQKTGVGVMPVSQLSDGIRSVLGLAADIAFRCCKLNSHLGLEATQQTPGIVLIDELDLHLHPAWQQTIVQAFQRAFPNIQFILTTHSPHLLSTVPAECIRILKDGEIIQPAIETEGEQSRVVLEDIFGVSTWPPVAIVDDLRRYQELVSQELYTNQEAKQLRQKLNDHYGKHHEELQAADILIRRFEALKAARAKKQHHAPD